VCEIDTGEILLPGPLRLTPTRSAHHGISHAVGTAELEILQRPIALAGVDDRQIGGRLMESEL
jgi:hypothetical protein